MAQFTAQFLQNMIYAIQEINIFYCKQGHQILIDLCLIPHLLEVYNVHMLREQCKNYFQPRHWQI